MPSRTAEKPDTDRAESKPPTPGHPIDAALSERFDLAEHRRYLARELDGVILDLGAGGGAMVPYLQTAVQREPALRLHAIEPDPNRRRQAKQTATTHNLDIHLQSGRAESLPYADDTFDVVIASAVFCTVQDPLLALEEVHRVVKPNGEFRFLEHVRSDGLRGYVQDVVTPLWKRIDNGCHLNRRTDDWIAAGPFALDEIETLRLGVSPSRPFVRGTATPVSHTETDSRISDDDGFQELH
ncbi:class I SAM-dependent methyltransferase [Natrialba taiwanensis]|uniref:Type 11 methyltransferase n=1 Tax=Natrialba taiwanensis DSM 12281 TaxID=1230458 RepID=M0A0U0_9EURY|nr:class I SAM-dependent methyltransferase [Natrialba taiwanensis]ELY90978.1 type 11 methyltransferase [Natrialba taiwanensis DSM 12281]